MTIMTQNAFAELAGVSRQCINGLVKNGKLATNKIGRIDTTHPDTVEYISRRLLLAQEAAEPPVRKISRADMLRGRRPPPRPEAAPYVDLPPDGPDQAPAPRPQTTPVTANRRDIELQKLAAEVQYKELKNAQLEGRLVARDAMIRGVFNPLETFLTRMLSDGAKTIAAKLYPVSQSGGTIEDAEVEARKQITMFIAPLRRSIMHALKLEK